MTYSFLREIFGQAFAAESQLTFCSVFRQTAFRGRNRLISLGHFRAFGHYSTLADGRLVRRIRVAYGMTSMPEIRRLHKPAGKKEWLARSQTESAVNRKTVRTAV